MSEPAKEETPKQVETIATVNNGSMSLGGVKVTSDFFAAMHFFGMIMKPKKIQSENEQQLYELFNIEDTYNSYLPTEIGTYVKQELDVSLRKRALVITKTSSKTLYLQVEKYIIQQGGKSINPKFVHKDREQTILYLLGLHEHDIFLRHLRLLYAKYLVATVAVLLGTAIVIAICLLNNLPAIAATMGANVAAMISLGKCFVVAVIGFIAMTFNIRRTFSKQYVELIQQYANLADERIMTNFTEIVKNLYPDVVSSASADLPSLFTAAEKYKDTFGNKLGSAFFTFFLDMIGNQRVVQVKINYQDNSLNCDGTLIPFRILKDCFKMCETVPSSIQNTKNDMEQMKGAELITDEQLRRSLFTDFMAKEREYFTPQLGQKYPLNALSYICWLDIKDKFMRIPPAQSGGGLMRMIRKDAINDQNSLGNTAYVKGLIAKQKAGQLSIPPDRQEAAYQFLLPFILILRNTSLMEFIHGRANEFVSTDKGDDNKPPKEYCNLKRFDILLKELPQENTVETQIPQTGGDDVPGDDITTISFDDTVVSSLRNCIFILITSRLLHNYAFVYDKIASTITLNTVEEQTKTLNFVEKYVLNLSAGPNMKMIHMDVYEVLMQLLQYQQIFEKNMEVLSKMPPAFTDTQGRDTGKIIREQCFRQQAPSGLLTKMSRMFKRSGGGKGKKTRPDTAHVAKVCQMYHAQRMNEICEVMFDKRTKQPKMVCYEYLQSLPPHMSCYEVLMMRHKKKKLHVPAKPKPVIKKKLHKLKGS